MTLRARSAVAALTRLQEACVVHVDVEGYDEDLPGPSIRHLTDEDIKALAKLQLQDFKDIGEAQRYIRANFPVGWRADITYAQPDRNQGKVWLNLGKEFDPKKHKGLSFHSFGEIVSEM